MLKFRSSITNYKQKDKHENNNQNQEEQQKNQFTLLNLKKLNHLLITQKINNFNTYIIIQ